MRKTNNFLCSNTIGLLFQYSFTCLLEATKAQLNSASGFKITFAFANHIVL